MALLVIQALLLLPTATRAATPEIVGTWRKADQSLVEFKNDGSVVADMAPVGSWERLKDSSKYVLRFKGASVRDFYYVTTGRYQRQLSLELPSFGTRTHLDRVDDGPTVNPDAPDEKEAQELEYNDLEKSIARTKEALIKALAEAGEAWQRHYHARSIGRISGWIPIAQRKEAEAKGLESSLNSQRESLKKMATKLGKPIPQVAIASATPTPVSQPVSQPSSGNSPLSTRSSHKIVSRVRSNQTPMINGPSYVPGSQGVTIPTIPVFQPAAGQFVPGQPMHGHRHPHYGPPSFHR